MSKHSVKQSVLERKATRVANVDPKTSGSQQDLDEEWARFNNEKKSLSVERAAMLAERANLDNKDKRLNGMFSELDDRESKLKRKMEHLEDQKEQWLRSATDLFRRETVIEDWQKNHAAREKRLKDLADEQEKRFNTLLEREIVVTEAEQALKTKESDFQMKEQRSEQYFAKVEATEKSYSLREENLTNLEGELRKREGEIEIREREMASRRRELESWDLSVKEREKKVSAEMHRIDDREDALKALDEKCKLRNTELEERLADVKEREDYAALKQKHFEATLQVFEEKEQNADEQAKRTRQWEGELRLKEESLNALEEELKVRREEFRQLEEREVELQHKIERHMAIEKDFFTNRVSQISTRHASEMEQLEKSIIKLLQFVSIFKHELDRFKDRAVTNHLNKTNPVDNIIAKVTEANVAATKDMAGSGTGATSGATAGNPLVLATVGGDGLLETNTTSQQNDPPPIHKLLQSYEVLVTDVKENLEQLKIMEDDRLRTIDMVEKLDKSNSRNIGKSMENSQLLPLQYGANANPLNGTTYSYQLQESYKELCKVVEKAANQDPSLMVESVKSPLISNKKGWGFLKSKLIKAKTEG